MKPTLRILLALAAFLASLHTPLEAITLTRTSAFDYDPATGLLIKEIVEPDDPALCVVTTYTYDAFGNKTASTTRNCNGSTGSAPAYNSEAAAPTGDPVFTSRTNTTTFDARGQFPMASSNALSHTETKVYDPRLGTMTSLTGPNGLSTTWTYDAFGRKTLETRADGTRTRWDYYFCWPISGGGIHCPKMAGASGAYVVVTTPLASDGVTQIGPLTKTYHDALNRPIRSETQGFDGTGTSTLIYQDTEYDSLGRPYRKSRPYYAGQTAYWTTITFDALSRPVQITEPDTATTLTAYHGLTVTVTDPKGQTRATIKNSQGQTIGVIDAAGSALSLRYDPFGNLAATIDPAGNVIANVHDLRGRKVMMTDPDMGTWRYAYDALGHLIRQVDAKGQTSLMIYDQLGRMTRRSEPDLISTWYYDAYKGGGACAKGIGKLCQTETDAGYNRRHSYDSLGRPSRTDITVDTLYTVSQSYYSDGRLATETYPNGVTLRYGYTMLGYLKRVHNGANNTPYWQADSLDAEGHLLQQTYGNRVVTQTSFNPGNGRVTGILAGVGGGIQNLAYQYDPVGNVTSRQDANVNLTETFGYDNLNRLTSTTVNGLPGISNVSMTYDALGNLTSRSDVGRYQYRASGSGSTQPHGVYRINLNDGNYRLYDYDGNGNLTHELEFDAANNIIPGKGRIDSPTSFNMPQAFGAAGISAAFVYGPEHQRVKQISSASGTTIYLNPGNSGELGYEKDIRPDGSIEQRVFVTAHGQVVALVKQVTAGATTTASVRYLHRDHLGSTTAVTDESGNIVERLGYEAFGKRRFVTGAPDPANTIVPVTTERGFTNHEHIDEIGVIHMNGRVYDPRVGRFMSPDPYIQDPTNLQSYNRYSYRWNNPVTCTDPSGYFSLKRFLRAAVAIAVAVFVPEMIGNAFTTAAANAAAASGTLSASTAFAT